MIIDIPKISPEGSTFVGEDPGEILALEQDKFAHHDGPVKYDLFAYLSSHELIVKGSLSAKVALRCGKCAGFFSTTLTVSSFLHAYPISERVDQVDLTEDIREDILVEIPTYPSCSWTGEGVCPFSGENLEEMKQEEMRPVENAWSVLDELGQSDTEENEKDG